MSKRHQVHIQTHSCTELILTWMSLVAHNRKNIIIMIRFNIKWIKEMSAPSTMMILMSLKKEKMEQVLESQIEVKVKDQLKQETSQEVVKILSFNSQLCSWCRSISTWVVQRSKIRENTKVFKSTDTAISATIAQTKINRTTMEVKIPAAFSVMIAQESWWVSQMKWLLDVDKLKVEINFWGKTHTAKWETLFVDLNTEMNKVEAGSNKYHNIILIQSSRRIWVVQARCINSTIQTTNSIKLPRAHTEMGSVTTLKQPQSVTKEQTKTW